MGKSSGLKIHSFVPFSFSRKESDDCPGRGGFKRYQGGSLKNKQGVLKNGVCLKIKYLFT